MHDLLPHSIWVCSHSASALRGPFQSVLYKSSCWISPPTLLSSCCNPYHNTSTYFVNYLFIFIVFLLPKQRNFVCVFTFLSIHKSAWHKLDSKYTFIKCKMNELIKWWLLLSPANILLFCFELFDYFWFFLNSCCRGG